MLSHHPTIIYGNKEGAAYVRKKVVSADAVCK